MKRLAFATLKGIILSTHYEQEALKPLLLFNGNMSLGRAASLWNFVLAMMECDIKSATNALRINRTDEDFRHIVGFHAPLSNMGLNGILARLHGRRDVADRVPGLYDYVRLLRSSSGASAWNLAPISETSQWSRRDWRRPKKLAPLAEMYPYITETPREEHNLLFFVDSCVPKQLPHQVRADVCQDIICDVLSGEIQQDELGHRSPLVGKYIRKYYKAFPMYGGPLRLDAPMPGLKDGDMTLGQAVTTTGRLYAPSLVRIPE